MSAATLFAPTLPRHGQTLEPVSTLDSSQTDRVPTMFRDLTTMRQPSMLSRRWAGGCAAARLNTSSSRAAPSSGQGTTPEPRAAAAKASTAPAGPVIVRW